MKAIQRLYEYIDYKGIKPKPFDSLKKSMVPLRSTGASSSADLLEVLISILSTSTMIFLEGSGGVLVR